jgi:hypothetical protein
MQDAALFISIISLLVSFVALYVRGLQGATIGFQAGSAVGFCRTDEGFEIYVPASFSNAGQRLGVVTRCALVVLPPGAEANAYYIEWAEFRKHDHAENRWARDEFAGPVTVSGRGSVTKVVYFRWAKGPVVLPPGEYKLVFCVWLVDSSKPTFTSTLRAQLPASEIAAMDPNRGSPIRFVPLDEHVQRNKVMTKQEITQLLGSDG